MPSIHNPWARWAEIQRSKRPYQIAEQAERLGCIQLRLHGESLLTRPFPARRGLGVRGELIGVYTSGVRPEWIAADVEAYRSQHAEA